MLSRLRSRVDRLCAYDHCRVVLPSFAWRHGRTAAERLHRAVLDLDLGPGPRTTAALAAAAALHLVRGTRDVLVIWRRQRAACRQGYGVGARQQLADLFVAKFRYNHPAKLYYALRMFRLPRSRWSGYFSHNETTLLLGRFQACAGDRALWTKRGWSDYCARHDIPSARMAATAGPDSLQVFAPELLRAGGDLFVKPDVDYSARGGILLEWDASAQGWNISGAASGFVPADGLEEFLRRRAVRERIVVQPRLRNAPEVADLASRALVNLRVVTLNIPGQGISILMAALRMPPADQPTSDVVGSTFSAPVDPATGRLGDAESGRLHLGSCPRHPFNGAQVRDRVLAAWPRMRELALAAHERLPGMPAVGWDLVATSDGVFILEANAIWHAFLAQHWGRAPLGETAWPECMLAALARVEAPAPAAA